MRGSDTWEYLSKIPSLEGAAREVCIVALLDGGIGEKI
jgi:hypothetical protein